MAYELTKGSINNFNKFYGVNISFGKIQADAARLNSYNQALMLAFQDAYKQAVLKDLIKRDGEAFRSLDMFKDFNDMITNSLINETPKSQRTDLSFNMGIETRLIAYNMMEAIWNDVPKNQVDAVAENYINGNIRIRDMVAFSQSIFALDNTKNKTMLASYALALKKVNEGRSLLWRIIHPFRNNAEQRDAKKMADMLKSSGERFSGADFTKAGSTLVNFDALEKETIEHVLKNKTLIEHRLSDEEKERRIEEDFKNNVIFEPGTTDEQKTQAYNNYRYRRMQEFDSDEVYQKQQEFQTWLKNLGNGDSVNEDNKDNAPENQKESIVINEAKDESEEVDVNQKIDDVSVKDKSQIIK